LFNGEAGRTYNIAANNEVNNLTIVKKILSIMDKPSDLIEFVEDRPGHDFRYSMTSKRISDELDWKVKTSFDEGLQKTVQWYLDNPEILNNISQTVLDPTPWKDTKE
jgi:dTDP-glucose 4,6-dehydratase